MFDPYWFQTGSDPNRKFQRGSEFLTDWGFLLIGVLISIGAAIQSGFLSDWNFSNRGKANWGSSTNWSNPNRCYS